MHRSARIGRIGWIGWTAAALLGLPLVAAASPRTDLSITRASPDHATLGSTAALQGFVRSSLAEAMRRHGERVSLRSAG
ncbi:secreted protein, partial [sediment metagenome]